VHKIELFLTMRKQYDLVSGKEAPLTEQKTLEKWYKINKEASAYIKICVSDEVFAEIKNLREGTKYGRYLSNCIIIQVNHGS
jgi:enolase